MKYWFYTISQGYESSVRFPLLLHEESLTENEANRKEWTKGESSVMLIEVLSQVIPEAYCLFLSVIIEKLCIYNLHIYTLYNTLYTFMISSQVMRGKVHLYTLHIHLYIIYIHLYMRANTFSLLV